MKKVGIWLDRKEAHIFELSLDGSTQLKTVQSEIEDFHVHGGSGTRFKGGPQDVVQDSKYLEREKHQFKRYFRDIARQLKDADRILIFGPAEAPLKLEKEFTLHYKPLASRVAAVHRADSMTENQMAAYVRDFFS